MHDLAFADSARPSRVVCLRLLLQPYSIGHELLLWRERNPILLFSREDFNALPTDQQIYHLIRAVSVCSRSWSENQKPEKWVRLWSWLIRKTDWPVAIADFRNYLGAGRKLLPKMNAAVAEDKEAYEIASGGEELGGSGRALGSPFLAQLMLFGMTTLRLKDAELYDFPFALAGSLYYTQLENEGRLNIENAKEQQVREEMVEHRAAIKAEKEQSAKEDKCQP